MSKRVMVRVSADAYAAAGTDKSKEFAVSTVRLLGRLLDGGRALLVEVSRSEVTPSLQQGAALGRTGQCRGLAWCWWYRELAETKLAANEGPDSAVVPAVHYKRATRLRMLAAEMLFSLLLEGMPQTANEKAPWDPVFAERNAQRDRLTGVH